jgi:uncharacterized membrane protein YjdF
MDKIDKAIRVIGMALIWSVVMLFAGMAANSEMVIIVATIAIILTVIAALIVTTAMLLEGICD